MARMGTAWPRAPPLNHLTTSIDHSSLLLISISPNFSLTPSRTEYEQKLTEYHKFLSSIQTNLDNNHGKFRQQDLYIVLINCRTASCTASISDLSDIQLLNFSHCFHPCRIQKVLTANS